MQRVASRTVQGFFRQLHGCGTCDSLQPGSAGAPPACGGPAFLGAAGDGPGNPYPGIGVDILSKRPRLDCMIVVQLLVHFLRSHFFVLQVHAQSQPRPCGAAALKRFPWGLQAAGRLSIFNAMCKVWAALPYMERCRKLAVGRMGHSRWRLASWLAVAAFGLAQSLMGLHVHAADAAETPHSLCVSCAYSAVELLPGPSQAIQVAAKAPRASHAAVPVAACAKRLPIPIQPRAPPAS